MPSPGPTPKSLQEVVDSLGLYPAEAFRFVKDGLGVTVHARHGEITEVDASHHITGADLCVGLRDVAWDRWGLMARLVLAKWNILTTLDFGRIVFAMVDNDLLQKTENDTIEDFRNVFDFRLVFEPLYKINPTMAPAGEPKKSRKKSSQ